MTLIRKYTKKQALLDSYYIYRWYYDNGGYVNHIFLPNEDIANEFIRISDWDYDACPLCFYDDQRAANCTDCPMFRKWPLANGGVADYCTCSTWAALNGDRRLNGERRYRTEVEEQQNKVICKLLMDAFMKELEAQYKPKKRRTKKWHRPSWKMKV